MISAPRVTCSRMIAASPGSSGPAFVRIESGMPILPTSWKRAAVPSVPSCFARQRRAHDRSRAPRGGRAASDLLCTGSRASTAAFSVSIVSRRLSSRRSDDSLRSRGCPSRSRSGARAARRPPCTRRTSASQRIAKTMPTTTQTVRVAVAMLESRAVGSSETCATPTGRPEREASGATRRRRASIAVAAASCAATSVTRACACLLRISQDVR